MNYAKNWSKSSKWGHQLWIWIKSNSFVRETRFSKHVLLAYIQHCKYDSEMSFKKLREEWGGRVPPVWMHCCQGLCICSSVSRTGAETDPQSSLQSVNLYKTMRGVFCYLISFLKVTLLFCGLSLGVSQKQRAAGQSDLPFGALVIHHSSWRGWADSGSHYPVLSQKVLWVI